MGKTIRSLYEEYEKGVEIIPVDKDSEVPGKSVKVDVAIDFSTKGALPDVLSYCTENGVPLVMGTTGHDAKDLENIHDASKKIPIFHSGNFSLGVYILKEAVKEVSRLLGEDADIEIIEKHHRKKKDAPSGTALMLHDAIEDGSGDHKLVYGRSGASMRSPGEIGMHAVRGGTIVGEHTVLFALDHEVLEFTHKGESRRLFGKGALKAADFIVNKAPGLYGMDDMMKERND